MKNKWDRRDRKEKTKKKFKRLSKKYPRQTLQKDMSGKLGW